MRLERRVADDVARWGAIRPGEHALLMLSGGADSMALLALLPVVDRRLGLGLRLSALHVDYRTRGADSDRDREIVVRACAAAGVPLQVERLERRLIGAAFQARARELRYGRARELAAELGGAAIVTAHNRDDQAETIVYRLAKYASPRGLVGMRPRAGGLSRPLLCVGAAELRDYCRRRGLEYGEDATNTARVYARNRVRHDVLPRLAELNPRVAETLSACSLQAAAEADVLADVLAAALARVEVAPESGEGLGRQAGGAAAGDVAVLDLAALRAEPPALQALIAHLALRQARGGEALIERRLVEALLRLATPRVTGRRVSLGGGLEAVRDGDYLRVRAVSPPHACDVAAVSGAALAAAGDEGVALAWCDHTYRLRLLTGAALNRADAALGQGIIGLDELPRLVALRHPRRGERFEPLGLGRETTVARYLAGARAPAAACAFALVVEVDGQTAWVGHAAAGRTPVGRVAQAYRVDQSSASTLLVTEEGR